MIEAVQPSGASSRGVVGRSSYWPLDQDTVTVAPASRTKAPTVAVAWTTALALGA
jgi:hypothetical protein